MLKEEKEFLLAQRQTGRKGCMGPVDANLVKGEQRLLKCDLKIKRQKEKECDDRAAGFTFCRV